MKTETNPRGAGRRRRYEEKTVPVAFRVPISKVRTIRQIVAEELEKVAIKKEEAS